MPGLFDYLESINSGKDIDLEQGFKEYVPFQINNGLSQHMDTVLLANEMNKRPWLSKEMQFKFLRSVTTKKRRFGKWAKVEEVANQSDIDTVSEYYEVNHVVANTYLKMLSEDHLNYMRKMNNKGGADIKVGRAKKK